MSAVLGQPGVVQTPPPKPNDHQIGGTHYKDLNPEPWDVILAWDLNWVAGNVVKYIARYKIKDGVDDLRKARHYLDKLIEYELRQK